MALKLEELTILLTANTDQLNTKLTNVEGQLDKLVRSSQKSGLQMTLSFLKANVLYGGLRKLVGIFSNVSREVISSGSTFSRMAVVTDLVAHNMGISQKTVDSMRATLARFNVDVEDGEEVIKTFALSNLIDLGNSIKYVDSQTGKTITGTTALITAITDLSAAAGIDAAQGMDRFAKFIRLGSVRTVDGILNIGKLTQTTQAYADSVGKTVPQLSQQELQQIRVNVVMEEANKVLGAYSQTALTSSRAFELIKNQSHQLFSTLGRDIEPILTVTGNAILTFVNGLLGALNTNQQAVQNWALRAAGTIVAFVRLIGRIFSKIPIFGAGFRALADFTLKPVKALGGLTNQTKSYGNAANAASNATKNLKKELSGLASFDELNVLTKNDNSGNAGTNVGGGGLGVNPSAIDPGINNSLDQINGFADKVTKKFQEIGDKVSIFIAPLISIFNALLPIIKAVATDGLFVLGGMFEYVLGIVEDLVKNKELFTALLITIGVILASTVVPATIAWAVALVAAAAGWVVINAPILLIGAALTAIIYIILLMIKHWSDLRAGMINMWNDAKRYATDAVNFLQTKVVNPLSKVVEGISASFNNIGSSIKRVFDSIVSYAGTSWNNIKTFLTRIKDGISNLFAGSDKAGSIANAFKEMMNLVIDKVNSTLDFHFSVLGKDVHIDLPDIHHFATGGVIDSPTIGLLGEAGTEAVVPLENNTGWMDKLANKINTMGDAKQNLQVFVGGKKMYDGVIDYINNKSKATGSYVLNI